MYVNRRIVVASAAALTLTGCGGPADYVELTPDKRERLSVLRKTDKFNPEKSADRNYPGPDAPNLKADLNRIIDSCLDAILAQPNGRLDGDVVREQFSQALNKLDHFSAADNDRAVDYMLQIWRTLGFKTRTGVLGEPDSQPGSLRREKTFIDVMLSLMGGQKN